MTFNNVLVSPHLGGAEQLAITIHRHVERARPGRAHLLVPRSGSAEAFAAENRLSFSTYSLPWLTGRRRDANLCALSEVAWRLRRSRAGLLHVHAPFVYGALRPLLSVVKVRTILHVHLDYSVDALRWALRRPPDRVVVCARFMRARIEAALPVRMAERTHIKVLLNAVDTQRFKPGDRRAAKHALGIVPERPLMLLAANLAPHKGQETAIRAISKWRSQGNRPLLWLVGEERDSQGSYTTYLRGLIAELGVTDCVALLGFRRDLPSLLQAADCLLLPSTSEGLPLSILEAQASRAVVVAAPTAGIPEVIRDGSTGFLIDAHDSEGYAFRLQQICTSPALAERIRDLAYEQVASKHRLDCYCKEMFVEYEDVMRPRER